MVVVPSVSMAGDCSMRTLRKLGTAPDSEGPLGFDHQIFTRGGKPWRYKAVSAFRLCRRFADGDDITGFLADYAGFNVLRVWDYTPVKDWGANAWNSCSVDEWARFITYVADFGFSVELTLLTDDDPKRIDSAKQLVGLLMPLSEIVFLEAGNEPTTHKNIDTQALKSTLESLGHAYCSGDYEDSDRWYGTYYTCHTARTFDWTRRAHDLYDFYTGAGPDKPHAPRHVPCLGDEPGKLQDVGSVATEWRAYFGACALLGGGACFHSATGLHGQRPTDEEKRLATEALFALNAFPADAPKGPYRRIVEPGNEQGGPTDFARTYVVGNYMVRCQQAGTAAPEPGWTPIDDAGVLWRR